MSDIFTPGSLDSKTLPGGDLNQLAILFAYSFWATFQLFIEPFVDLIPFSASGIFEAIESADC